jgi:hypothetical protein
VTYLSDLTAQELAMLGHALRLVPDNACLTGKQVALLGGNGISMFYEIDAFKTLWEKVAVAISEREDMDPFRKAST